MPVQLKFRALTAKVPIIRTDGLVDEVTRYVENFVDVNVLRVATTYPPERPNQRYVRTFKLQRSWKLETTYTTSALTVRAVSRGIGYVERVQGLKQWPMHAETGWPIIPLLKVDRAAYRAGLMQIYKKRAI